MLENNESFIYIKNDDEVNLKTDRFNTEPYNKNSFFISDLSDSQIISANPEIFDLENKNNILLADNILLLTNNNANNNQVYNRTGTLLSKNGTLNNNNISSDNNEKQLLRNSKIKKSYIEEDGPKIISLDQVPLFRKLFIQVHPIILNGYRIHHQISECFVSVFKLHNETLNIWSHMLPFIGFLVLLTYLIISKFQKKNIIKIGFKKNL